MEFFDPHIHIASRTTDDIEALALAGCRVVGEPAFWMGYNRSGANSFYDYFRQLTEWEPQRTAKYGIQHYAWMGINAKEAEDTGFAREVIGLLPEMLERPNVMLFHTPHLEDKYKGTRMILDLLGADSRVEPDRVCIDHCEEHTIRYALEAGYWAGITLYPTTKATPQRAADMVELYGPERILVNSSADWGPSDPLAVARFILEMRRRGHDDSLIRQVVLNNPLRFFSREPALAAQRRAAGRLPGDGTVTACCWAWCLRFACPEIGLAAEGCSRALERGPPQGL